MKMNKRLKRVIVFFLLFILAFNYIPPSSASAANVDHKVVRVGWFDSSFNYYDKFGRRCGIGYEYQQKISAYTGWTYEYVEDSWPNLLQMLKNGEIDLLSDVSYRPEREPYMLYPDLPIGTESYYIYIDDENRKVNSANPKSAEGMRIGVNNESIQAEFLKEWAGRYGLKIDIVLLNVGEDESMKMVETGELDGYAAIYTFDSKYDAIPVFRIGGSDYFFAVNKNRSDLLVELNMALSQIQDEDPYFNQKITEDRLYGERTNALLSPNHENWIKEHGPIRIGYCDNYLPFCDMDNKTGELTGALKDYLAHAENSLNSIHIQFETIAYESTDDAVEALKAGEVDCIFPVYFSTYDADKMEIRLTNPAMKTEMIAIMRSSDKRVLSEYSDLTVAVNEGMRNIETFIMDMYPSVERKPFPGLNKCYKAVADKKADCVLVSSYRIPAAEKTLKKYDLCTVPTGESVPLSFAVKRWDSELCLIMNKTVLTTKTEEMDAALASYMQFDRNVTVDEFIKENWILVMAILIVVFTVIIILLIQKIKADKTASNQRRMLDEAAEVADLKQTISSLLDNMPGMNFTKDAETGEYLACNQAFAAYAQKKDPSEVVGLKPTDIFDEERAKRFMEDDKVALSMDEPYIFFEDVYDEYGNVKQIKTTKQKYVDANGRLCVLGIFLDVTDSFRISRENSKTKESYEKARSTGHIVTHIAQTLARGYTELYYIDLNTEEFIEYRTDAETGSLYEARRGWHFFEECQDEADLYVYPEDQDSFKNGLDRKTLLATLDRDNTFMMTYRLKSENGPVYTSLKVTRMQDDDRYIIISVTDVDEQMKQRNAIQKIQEEQIAYNRISALAGDFIGIYVIDPENGNYRVLSSTVGFNAFDIPPEGDDFFTASRQESINVVFLDDQSRFLSVMTKENVVSEVERNGIFTLSYRLATDGEPRYVQIKAAMVEEEEGPRLIVGINDIDAQVRQEEEYGKRLAQARIEANIDALTGVKNRNAYRVYEERLNAQIEMNRAPAFAIVILDVNDLKIVNDTLGHKAGDQYLRDACKVICTTFKRSPVFRVGGDEFCVLAQGDDYGRLDELVELMNEHNDEAIKNGGVVVALGVSRYKQDSKVASVYERADQRMYENKSGLKAKKKNRG